MPADPREAMIRAGERLFAERGIEAVSLREVASAAGQGNNSAVRYHFGSRDGLVDAIFAYRMARVDERRRAMLAAMEAESGGRPLDLRSLVEAAVFPLTESIGHDDGVSWYARFLRQTAFRPGFDIFSPALEEQTRGLRAVAGSLNRHLLDVPSPLREHRVLLAFELVVHALADHEAFLDSGTPPPLPASLLAAQLVDAAMGVLEAPVSEVTAAQLRRSTRKGA